MDLCIINRKNVKKNKSIRKAQKISKKYFKYSTYQNKKNEPKTKIEKYVDIQNIEMVSLTNKNCDNQVVGSANKDEFANDISKIQKEEVIAKVIVKQVVLRKQICQIMKMPTIVKVAANVQE